MSADVVCTNVCSDCIHECTATQGMCPLCRVPLTVTDIFDAATDQDAEAARQRLSVKGDYGTKVSHQAGLDTSCDKTEQATGTSLSQPF